ncbi:MAG: D-glycero-beta-D-manno-heptose 1-phosphate adenylyltransferase [Candidatus Omnitrophica bacterium]|nr:D-glycero-beta-D-manno-heptose 1-phosphate adenylyltransferase [Candidatus Omnitrophota bacterium]
MSPKLKSLSELVRILKRERSSGKKVVFTNGCFDLLHVGHVRYLKEAKSLGDILVVGLNSDASVRRLKGKARPLVPQSERAEVLGSLECVNYVVVFRDSTPERLIRAISPHFLVKGGDWNKAKIVGREWVESHGGKVMPLRLVSGRSTSRLAEKIREQDAAF